MRKITDLEDDSSFDSYDRYVGDCYVLCRFDDEDILDISGITAFFGLSNRMAIVTGMQANREFYTMAREPRA